MNHHCIEMNNQQLSGISDMPQTHKCLQTTNDLEIGITCSGLEWTCCPTLHWNERLTVKWSFWYAAITQVVITALKLLPLTSNYYHWLHMTFSDLKYPTVRWNEQLAAEWLYDMHLYMKYGSYVCTSQILQSLTLYRADLQLQVLHPVHYCNISSTILLLKHGI